MENTKLQPHGKMHIVQQLTIDFGLRSKRAMGIGKIMGNERELEATAMSSEWNAKLE